MITINEVGIKTILDKLLEWHVKPKSVIINDDITIIRVYDSPALYKHLDAHVMDITNRGNAYQAEYEDFVIQWIKSGNIPLRGIRRTQTSRDSYAGR